MIENTSIFVSCNKFSTQRVNSISLPWCLHFRCTQMCSRAHRQSIRPAPLGWACRDPWGWCTQWHRRIWLEEKWQHCLTYRALNKMADILLTTFCWPHISWADKTTFLFKFRCMYSDVVPMVPTNTESAFLDVMACCQTGEQLMLT